MKPERISFFALPLLSACIFFSCASSPEHKISSVYVMVYDYDSSGIMDVSVFIDGEEIGKTDIYGRLLFSADKLKETEHSIRAEKSGYESAEITSSVRPGQLLYFKMRTGSYYADLAEKLLDENEAQDAFAMICRALEIDGRTDWRFLKDIIQRRVEK